jgi:hypothetical protein
MRRIGGVVWSLAWICLLLVGFLAGCSFPQPQDASPTPRAGLSPGLSLVDLPVAFPSAEALDGWIVAGETEVYDRETLYSLVNGQADLFFGYGFEQAAVQSYQDGEGATIRLTIWQVATPEDAYGLFTVHAADSTASRPVKVGNAGSIEPGQRLVFWRDRYFVDLFAFPPQPEDQRLLVLAEATSSRLPSGGEPPAVMSHLPADGLVASSALYFHEEISIQDRLWLGGENLLGLGPETDGVLARYDLEGSEAQLLLVRYPTTDAASAGLVALQSASLDGLVASAVQEDWLGSVWGGLDENAAQDLLAKALSGQ